MLKHKAADLKLTHPQILNGKLTERKYLYGAKINGYFNSQVMDPDILKNFSFYIVSFFDLLEQIFGDFIEKCSRKKA